jgi:nucleoid DNA-binding protein
MGKMTIQDVSRVLSERKGLNKKDASNFVNLMFDIIQQALERDGIVKVKGLGTFKIIDVDARESVNVNTGERVLIEGHNKITFTPDSLLKELVNKPFSQFETVVLNDGVDFDEPVDLAKNEEPMPSVDADIPSEPAQDVLDASSIPLVDFNDDYKENPVSLGESPEADTPEVTIPEKSLEPEISSVSVPEEPERIAPSENEVTEDEVTEDDDEAYHETTSDGDGKKWLYALVACLIGFACGYLLGALFPFTSNNPQNQAVVEKSQPVVMQPVKKSEAEKPKEDTAKVVKIETENPKSKAETQENKAPIVETVKAESKNTEEKKPVEKPVVKPAEEVVDKYSAMDPRVRTGAYRIVGTAQTVKVKEGDNLLKISRRNLGPDMECYLEVYNNLKASSVLKTGQEIKIPKLELKKKKKAQSVKQ